MTLIEEMKDRAKKVKPGIVLPEGSDNRIIKASSIVTREMFCRLALLGNRKMLSENVKALDIDPNLVEIIDPASSPKLRDYAAAYHELRKIPEDKAAKILTRPLYFAAMMVRLEDADGMVAGAVHRSDDVIMVSKNLIGMQPNVLTPSSFFIMEIPSYRSREGNRLIFADCAVNPDPTPEQLAEIAIATANSAKRSLGWQPRVAMLSFSTKGSAMHPCVQKVVRAVEIVKKIRPDLLIDGDLQADAALVLDVARRKIKGESPVAGKANILIFPNLDSGNIAYKLVQRLANAKAYGPILQGFAKPVSDLSRGATAEDIAGTIAIVAALASS